MGVSFYEGTFNKLSGNGTQNVTGLPFQPKAIIFWTTSQASAATFENGATISYGFTDGTNSACTVSAAEDNVATSDCRTVLYYTTFCIYMHNIDADNAVGTAQLTSFNSDGFTLSWTNSSATTYPVHFMMIGGTDITNVKVGSQTVGTSSTGSKAYTGVGFQPDFLLTANNGYVKASAVTDGEALNHFGIGVSAMKSSSERWSVMNVIEGSQADSDSWRYKREDKCFSLLDHTSGTVTGEADFTSFDTDGWTWNYSTAGTNITNSRYIYLAIKGGIWDVGSQAIGVTGVPGRYTNTSSTGRLKGVGFAFTGLIAGNNTPNATAIGCFGGTDGTRQSYAVFSDLDAAATMANVRRMDTTAVNYGTVANATAASSTTFAVATASLGTSLITTNWTSIDANAYLIHYFAVSEAFTQPTTAMQVVKIVKDTTTTNGNTQDFSLDFNPKAIMIFANASITEDSFVGGAILGYGFSDGTNQACVSVRSVTAAATSDSGGSHRTDSVIALQSGSTPANVLYRASCSFVANGFRLTHSVNNLNAFVMYAVAFGGSDLTNAKVGTASTGRTTTGTQDYTGLGFNPSNAPDSILFTINNNTITNNANESIFSMGIGCAVSSSKRWAYANCVEDARAASDTWKYGTDLRCLASLVDTTGALDYLADFDSWITDGFRLDYEDAPASASDKFSYLVIKGGKWDVGTETTPSTATTDTTTVNTALNTIKGIGLVHHSSTTVNSVSANAAFAMGYTDGTNKAWTTFIERTAKDPTVSSMRNSSGGEITAPVITDITTNVASLAWSSVLSSFGTNQFTINYTSAPGAAFPIGWWALGKGLTNITDTLTTRYNIEQRVTDTSTLRYNITSLVSDTLTLRNNITTLISDTLSVLYNINTRVSDTLTTRFNITQLVTDTLTLRNDINQLVTDTLTLRNNIEQRASDTLTIRYDITQFVSDTLTLINNINSSIAKKLKINFHVGEIVTTYIPIRTPGTYTYSFAYLSPDLIQISNSTTLRYNIEHRIMDSSTLRFNIVNTVSDTLTTLFNLEQRISKTNTLLYHIEAKIMDSTTLIYNIQQIVSDTNTLRFNITNTASDTLTLRYDIIQQITDTLTTLFDINQRVSNTSTLRFNIEQTIIDLLTLRYNITNTVTDTSTLRFDISQLVSDTSTLVFNINQLASDTLTLRYDIIQTIEDLLTIIYDIESEVSVDSSIILRFNIAQLASDVATLRFNITNTVSDTSTLRFDIAQLVTDTLTLRHNIEARITDNLNLLYNIEQKITDTSTLRFNITNTVSDTSTLRFDINQLASNTLTTIYDIRQLVTRVTTLLHNIEAKVSDTLTTRFNITNTISDTLTTLFNITNTITDSLTLRNDINARVTDTSTIRYDINQQVTDTLNFQFQIEAIGVVMRSLSLLYNIIETVSDTSTLRFNITNTVSDTSTLRFNVTQLASDNLTLKYNIQQLITDTCTLLFNIEQKIPRNLTLKYDINARIQDLLTTLFNINQVVTDTNTLRFNITNTITDTSTLRFNITTPITQDSTLIFNINQLVSKNLTTRFDVIQTMLDTLTIRYNITNTVSDTSILRFDIAQRITSELATIYDIITQIESNKALLYNITNTVSNNNTLRFNITIPVSEQLSTIFNINARTTKDLIFRFDLGNLVGGITIGEGKPNLSEIEIINRVINFLKANWGG